MNEIKQLEPKGLWKHFYSLTQIPRPSKKEEEATAFMKKFGEDLGLETIVDEIGNVIIKKPATPGMEDLKGIILQGHLDIVPQKNSDTDHDFEKDPIEAYIDGEWVTAKGTTLGADNGMGVAAAMAVLESTDIPHPYVEGLFTIDEETGMTGANGLKPGILEGDILLNMDSEDEGELYVGCAGGIDTNVSGKFNMQDVPAGVKALKIHLKGLKGGHSGLDINRGRGNANKLMFRLFDEAKNKAGLKLASVSGGDLRNAVPRESVATVCVTDPEELMALAKRYLAMFQSEFEGIEEGIDLTVEDADMPKAVLADADFEKIISAVLDTPHGVIKMSESMEGMVETSTNLAVVKLEDGELEVKCLTRSAVDEDKNVLAHDIKKIYDAIGCDVALEGEYPGWKPNMDSEILKTMQHVYKDIYGKTPEIKAIHAGLECGILGSAYPNWDMISFGPTIRFPHSPDEKVNIETVERFWNWLVGSLKAAPKK